MGVLVNLLCSSITTHTLLAFAVILLGILVFKKIREWFRVCKLLSKLPGPTGFQLLGYALKVGLNSPEYTYKLLTDLAIETGPIGLAWGGPMPLIFLTDPEYIKFVVNHPEALHKGVPEIKMFQPIVGDSLLTAHPSKWKGRRALIRTTFSKPVLNSFVPIMVQHSKELVGWFESHLDQEVVNLAPFIHKASMNMILGVYGMLRSILLSDIHWVHSTGTTMGVELDSKDKQAEYITSTDEYVWDYTVLRERKRIQNEITNNPSGYYDQNLRPKPSIDILLRLSKTDPTLTETELISEVNLIILGGYETTAIAITSTIFMLAMHPDVQEKAYQELWDVFGNSGRDITERDFQNLPYLEMVIKETLRMFPTIPGFMRKSAVDLEIGGYNIPKGTTICIWVPSVHRNELYWPNPNVFDPMRFTPEEIAKRNPYCYIPFSGGQRNCIGKSYAQQGLKIQIATLLRSYRFSTTAKLEDMRLEFAVAFKSIDGYPVQISKRKTPQDFSDHQN